MSPYTAQTWHYNDLTTPLNPPRMTTIENGIASAYVTYNIKDATYGATGDGTTDDSTAIQNALNACSAAGGGVVEIPSGTFAVGTTLTVASNVTIAGVGKNLSILKAKTGTNVSPVLASQQVSNVTTRITLRDFSIVGDSAVASAIGLRLSGVTLSLVSNIRISGYTGTSQLCLQLTSWNDGGTFRRTIENTLIHVETVGTNGIKITQDAADTSTSGSTNNTFIHARSSSFTGIGIDIDAGEATQLIHCIATTPSGSTTCIRVHDDVCGLYSCNTDCSAGGGNGATGVLITTDSNNSASPPNDTFIFQRTGNGPQFPLTDNGTNTIVLRHPDTHIGGTIKLGNSGNALGFYGSAGAGKPTISGAKGGNAALTSLLTALQTLGLVTDSTT